MRMSCGYGERNKIRFVHQIILFEFCDSGILMNHLDSGLVQFKDPRTPVGQVLSKPQTSNTSFCLLLDM